MQSAYESDGQRNRCQQKETDAEIHIRLFVDSQYFCISVSNKSSVDVTKTNPHLISTKADRAAHGLGTKVIQSIVDHYHGISRRYMDNGRYVVDIMLPMGHAGYEAQKK